MKAFSSIFPASLRLITIPWAFKLRHNLKNSLHWRRFMPKMLTLFCVTMPPHCLWKDIFLALDVNIKWRAFVICNECIFFNISGIIQIDHNSMGLILRHNLKNSLYWRWFYAENTDVFLCDYATPLFRERKVSCPWCKYKMTGIGNL